METIWKFPLKDIFVQKVAIPKGARILTVQPQKGVSCIWAVCDEDAPKEERVFVVYGTGRLVNKVEGTYIGTAQCALDDVQHIFELSPGDSLNRFAK